jgi:SAM-dependent methyltransferase
MTSTGRSEAFFSASVPENYDRYLAPSVFVPWAQVLIDFADVASGSAVLDVACGTGAVARLVAQRIGPDGRVVASDISPAMVGYVATQAAVRDGAQIETAVCSALDLTFDDASFDVVLCQHALPFMPDRDAAAREMRRVLRPGGVAAVAVWAAGWRNEPFETYGDVLRDAGVDAPFPDAYDAAGLRMTEAELREIAEKAGFSSVAIETRELHATWTSVAAAVNGITGTPFGPPLAALNPDDQQRVRDDLAQRLTALGAPTLTTRSVLLAARA